MNSKDVCFRLLRAESERQVDECINSVSELADSTNWYPIDERETNFNVVTNQASTGSKALTELCTNMVDAVLMKHAHMKGIEPRGSQAPRSVTDAVRDLVQLKGSRSGILAEVDDEEYLRTFAEKNLIIGVTGGRTQSESLCFTFIDNGEGQRPNDFRGTFLSLSTGSKSDISFVQGKYNMGSSGVLNYCGRRWYKLIVSRRFDESGPWGWTLVRRRPSSGKPVAEFFSINETPLFPASVIHPMTLGNGDIDDKVHLSTGTIVKLYDYKMESAASFRNIRESLNENLISTVLPFRLMDYRVTPQRTGRRAQGVDERTVSGMEFLLLRRDRSESTEDDRESAYEPGTKEHVGNIDDPELGRVSVQAIIPRRQPSGKHLPTWLAPPRNTDRVFHTVNGQVQYKEKRGYLSQQCGFPALKDRVVIIVDASELSEAGHNDVWKGDRENVRATEVGQLYREKITEVIKDSPYLKELQGRIVREETDRLTEQGRVELFQGLVDNDPSIAQLLPGGMVVTLPGYVGREEEEDEKWQGKYSPTFLDLVGKSVRQEGGAIELGGRRKVLFETDAVNDYFSRPDNRGRVFTSSLAGRFSQTSTLRNGILTMTFTADPNKVKVGEDVRCSVSLLDDAMPEPVTAELLLRVVQERRILPGGGRRRRKSSEDEEQKGTEGRALPPFKWLTRDGRLIGETATNAWPEEFTEQDGGYVEDLGDVKFYFINYDNAHFRRFLDVERDENNKKVITEQYRIGMLVLMLGVEDAYSRMDEGETKTELANNIDEIRRLAAQGAATVVLSIAKTLPSIVNPSSVSDSDDD